MMTLCLVHKMDFYYSYHLGIKEQIKAINKMALLRFFPTKVKVKQTTTKTDIPN